MLLASLLVIQLIPVEHNVSPLQPGKTFEMKQKVPVEVAVILKKSCYDCHSNNTRYPWYAEVQPAAGYMARHIKKGKEELNFDDFDSYSKRRKKAKIRSIISQIENDEMPLTTYRIMHSSAGLSAKDKKVLLDFFQTLN